MLDEFSYADIAMTMAVGILAPPEPPLFGPASNGPTTPDAAVLERHADLVKWRARLLARHHPMARSTG